jgi:hypothetical protein
MSKSAITGNEQHSWIVRELPDTQLRVFIILLVQQSGLAHRLQLLSCAFLACRNSRIQTQSFDNHQSFYLNESWDLSSPMVPSLTHFAQLDCPPLPVDPHWRRFESIRTLWGSQNPNHKTTATFSLPKQFQKATYAQPNLLGCKSLQSKSILHHCMWVITIPSYPWSCCSRSQTFPDMQRHTKQIRPCSSTQVGTKWISQHP